MNRKFVRVSLGGMHDEAEIRGHRRTYIGALPGNIIQAIRKAGARNCVMMLDEIDKLGAGIQGDPSAALLEVLDPEQNNSFRDNYLGVPFDLSRVVFITTGNMLDTIPGPLRDRMEIIGLAGYIVTEKREIARRYLVRRQMEANGLKAGEVEITESALGDVMKESGQAALSIVKNGAAAFGTAAARFERIDIHIHVPAGATPKDGPSAGVAMFMALVSLMTERTVRSDTAMTGEISLRGLVLPVGGIKEKVVGADGAGIRRGMLPARNRKEFDDIAKEGRQQVEVVWLERIEQVVAA